MKKLILISCIAFLFSCTSKENEELKNREENKLYPFEGYMESKQFPNVDFPIKAYFQSLKALADNPSLKSTAGTWDVQGPGNIGARINTVAVHPDDSNIIYAGFSHGGVFKTVDGGANWNPIFDEQAYLSISEITIDQNDPDLLYVGTGDHNISGYPFVGDGIYKSEDAGVTWQNIGLGETSIISRINIAPTNNNIIYAATMGLPFEKNINRGLYKSLDKGSSWEQILFVNDSTGVIDLLVHPENPDILYAASWNRIRNNKTSVADGPDAKIHKSLDGGDTWTILEGGLPQENFSRIGLAMSTQNPEKIYALYIGTGYNVHNVYVTEDGGGNWIDKSAEPFNGVTGGFGWYFGQIRVNPQDDNDIFILGVDLIRSKDGGDTWEEAAPPWWTYEVHADKHDLIIEDGAFYLATDGGLYRSSDDAITWVDIEDIPTTQFYRVAYNPHRPDLYYGGAQDNGSTSGSLNEINQWERIWGGDGFQMVFNPNDDQHFYVETQGGNINYTINGGVTFDDASNGLFGGAFWDAPYFMSIHDSNVMYYGGENVFKTEDSYLPEWQAISPELYDPISNEREKKIVSLAESPLNPNILMAGTSDGQVWKTEDQGQNWTNIAAGIRMSYISDVYASTYDESVMYVTVTAYKDNDNTAFIYRSEDGGDSWESIQGNLPQLSINEMLIYPESLDQVIFVATDGGVYVTVDGGGFWDRLGDDMPVIPVYDLTYNPVKDEVVAGTFARGIQSFDLSQIDLQISNTNENIINDLEFTLAQNSSLINIEWSERHGLSMEASLINNAGVIIYNGKLDKGATNHSIDVVGLPSGVYYVQLKNKRYKKSKKIIII